MRKPKSYKKRGIIFQKQTKKEESQKSVGTPVFHNFILNCPDQRAFPIRELAETIGLPSLLFSVDLAPKDFILDLIFKRKGAFNFACLVTS